MMHLNQFPQETQDFIYELLANAVLRAIKNGTYKPKPALKQTLIKSGS